MSKKADHTAAMLRELRPGDRVRLDIAAARAWCTEHGDYLALHQSDLTDVAEVVGVVGYVHHDGSYAYGVKGPIAYVRFRPFAYDVLVEHLVRIEDEA